MHNVHASSDLDAIRPAIHRRFSLVGPLCFVSLTFLLFLAFFSRFSRVFLAFFSRFSSRFGYQHVGILNVSENARTSKNVSNLKGVSTILTEKSMLKNIHEKNTFSFSLAIVSVISQCIFI